MVSRFLLLAASLLLGACGDDPCPRGSMSESVEGILVSEEEHPTGWGLEDCSECHAFAALHRLGCTPDVDLEAIRAIVSEKGEASCTSCHGDNGVEP